MKTTTKRKLLSIFYPERCPYCFDVVRPCELYCEECKSNLPANTTKKKINGVYEVLSVVPYDGVYKSAILSLKSGDNGSSAYQLAGLMAQKLIEEFEVLSFDVITFVPLHPEDEKSRGISQCKILAKYLSEFTDIPYNELLKKTKKNSPQHSLPADKRQKNVQGVFKATDKKLIKGKRILLIDDIVTTGFTLGECTKILEKNGALEIYTMTFAFSVPKTT